MWMDTPYCRAADAALLLSCFVSLLPIESLDIGAFCGTGWSCSPAEHSFAASNNFVISSCLAALNHHNEMGHQTTHGYVINRYW
jgi:hypothetical protein